MLKNYLKIAWRNISRNKSFALINSLGLALGFLCCILIYTFVQYHLSFDDFHHNSERIYRMVTEEHRDYVDYEASVPPALGREFRDDYNYAEKVARIATMDEEIISIQKGAEKQKYKDDVAFVEKEFFEIFNYPVQSGNPQKILEEPNAAIITKRTAEKYFGNKNPLGKNFQLDGRIDLTVRGILKNIPANTRFQSEIYISYPTVKEFGGFVARDSWEGISSSLQCYTLLRPGAPLKTIEEGLFKYVAKHRPTNTNVHHYKLQPLADIHFNTQYDGTISKKTLIAFSFIGLFLILAACINFINMSTAQAMSRSREVGVQKVLGGHKWQLFKRFLGETFLLSFFALIIGLVLAYALLPFLNQWFDVNILPNRVIDGQFVLFIAMLLIAASLLSGIYPGLLLSGISPSLALKGKITPQHAGGLFTRKSLIVTQFMISQVLIIGMVIIGRQMHFAIHSDLGFDKEAVLTVPIPTNIDDAKRKDFKNRLLAIPGVDEVTACLAPPSSSDNWGTGVRYGNRQEDEPFSIQVKAGDQDYAKTFGLEFVAGRNFFPSDTIREFVVNEMLVKKLNLSSPEEVIGKMLHVNGGTSSAPIVGVVKDFHDMNLQSGINPVFIAPLNFAMRNYAVKINMNNAGGILQQIEAKWSAEFPDYIFEYEFVDEHIANFYASERRALRLIQVFTALAIFISCLGMLGLISFLVKRKTKEVGVRKVLGGSVAHILGLFVKEFITLILIAGLIATPIAWLATNHWLENFQYKIDIGIWVFVLAIGASFGIALLTAGIQSLRAAFMNPAKSLRTE